jgi:ribosome-binding protein aMBF1 (putative translation factor)
LFAAALKIRASGFAGRSSEKPEMSKSHSLPSGRVALLGIAQRRISVKFSQKMRKENHAKPLPESIKTLADWIQVKRYEKNLTHGQLAAKMGIATALVRSWEDGTSQPDSEQVKVLAELLGCKTDF